MNALGVHIAIDNLYPQDIIARLNLLIDDIRQWDNTQCLSEMKTLHKFIPYENDPYAVDYEVWKVE